MWASASRWARLPSQRPEAAPSLALAVALLAAGLVGACSANEEAEQVLGRIDRMRDAPIEERGAAIRELAALTPRHPGALRAREVCLQAYGKLQEAHERVASTKAAVERMQAKGVTPRYEEVTAADEAVSLMLAAKKAEPACARAVAELRRALR